MWTIIMSASLAEKRLTNSCFIVYDESFIVYDKNRQGQYVPVQARRDGGIMSPCRLGWRIDLDNSILHLG